MRKGWKESLTSVESLIAPRIWSLFSVYELLLKAFSTVKQDAEILIHVTLNHKFDILKLFLIKSVPIQKFSLQKKKKKKTSIEDSLKPFPSRRVLKP